MKIDNDVIEMIENQDPKLLETYSQDQLRNLLIQGELGIKSEETSALRAKLIETLPIATELELAVLIKATREESQIPEGYKANWDFVLAEGQKQELKSAKEERIRECKAKKEEVLQSVFADEEEEMVSHKLRINAKNGTSRRQMTFEKKHGKDPMATKVFVEKLKAMGIQV